MLLEKQLNHCTQKRLPREMDSMTNKNDESPRMSFSFGDSWGDSKMDIWCDGRKYDEHSECYRPIYAYSIVTSKWRYDGDDIFGAPNELPNIDMGAKSLIAFLIACSEARDASSENYDLFPPQVREWANHYSSELTIKYAEMMM